MQRRIIVVEDEKDLAELISHHLEREGYAVACYANGEQGMAAIDRDVPDLVVLDLMLPGIDGFEICRRIRRSDRLAEVLILMLTARGEDADIVTGLELGADDYLTKPFSPRVLVARLRALFRRAEVAEPQGEIVRVGPLEIDSGRHEVQLDGQLVPLTHMEFRILRFLATRPGRVRTRVEILGAIGEENVLDRTVDVHVASLRRKLGGGSDLLETVRGVGYRLKD